MVTTILLRTHDTTASGRAQTRRCWDGLCVEVHLLDEMKALNDTAPKLDARCRKHSWQHTLWSASSEPRALASAKCYGRMVLLSDHRGFPGNAIVVSLPIPGKCSSPSLARQVAAVGEPTRMGGQPGLPYRFTLWRMSQVPTWYLSQVLREVPDFTGGCVGGSRTWRWSSAEAR